MSNGKRDVEIEDAADSLADITERYSPAVIGQRVQPAELGNTGLSL